MNTVSYVNSSHRRVLDAVLAALDANQVYSLTLKNNSAADWTFYVYQQMPKQDTNVFSIAWFASPFVVTKGAEITFEWSLEYGFVWSSEGLLQPGVTFKASGKQPADLTQANSTTFLVSPGPHLTEPVKGGAEGSLVITDDSGVPNGRFSVGISMSGKGTFVAAAGPNLTHMFTPTPNYWIAAGTNVRVGTVLDIKTVTQAKQAIFPVNTYDLVYSLNESNQWVVE